MLADRNCYTNYGATGGVVLEDGTLAAAGSWKHLLHMRSRTFSPAMFRFGGAYLQGQRFFPESDGSGVYDEDTLSIL